ncbi:conserved hypothetical protein [Ricinus communis]|uniref:Uncharacterized protein n=1 Tax=Ricinus communis TaxID=3988 RepID=B9S3L1_RICCO|nr:conserved hypothetical protein [Ricinus communis]
MELFEVGSTHPNMNEWLIFRTLQIRGITSIAPKILIVHKRCPRFQWYKINSNGAANGAPGRVGARIVVHNFRGKFPIVLPFLLVTLVPMKLRLGLVF